MNERETRLAIEYITAALDDMRKILKVYTAPKGSKRIKDAFVDSFMISHLDSTVDRLCAMVDDLDDEKVA